MEGFLAAAALLPPALRREAAALPEELYKFCEEFRLRRGRRAAALVGGKEYGFGTSAVTEEDLRAVLETATQASVHAAAHEFCRGFVSAPGGVRVGVCGTAVMGPAGMETIRDFSSLSLRIPRAMPGCAAELWDAVTTGGFRSALIVSPPGAGKTTLLRELIRRLSDAGYRVAVADERGEIGGSGGEPMFDLGLRTDIMTSVPKAQGVSMLIRAMNPQIVAMDEVTDSQDVQALLEAAGCGVRLLATAHGERGGADSVVCGRLMEAGAFERRIWVENQGGVRRYAVEAVSCA